MTGRELPGLQDRRVLAFPPEPMARFQWLPTRRRSRWPLFLITYLAGAASAALLILGA